MKPNLIMEITPEPELGGMTWKMVQDDEAHGFNNYFLFEDDDLNTAIIDEKLQRKRRPYLLKFYGAALEKETEYSFGYPTGGYYPVFAYKSVKVSRLPKVQS